MEPFLLSTTQIEYPTILMITKTFLVKPSHMTWSFLVGQKQKSNLNDLIDI